MRVIIVGGGIGGLTTALCLADRGHQIEVLEQAEATLEVGAGIQLSPNCTRVLIELGLEEALAGVSVAPAETVFRDWRSGRRIAGSVLGETARSRFGAPYYHIHRGDLISLLQRAVDASPRISRRQGVRVEDVHQDHGSAFAIAAGQSFEGDVIIGADGIHSLVRTSLWGRDSARFTGNVAWRFLVPAERLADDAVTPTATVWWGPGKHFVRYPVRRGELVNCVCVVEKEGWEVESWTERGTLNELREDFAGWHEAVTHLVERVPEDAPFKWALFDRPAMKTWGRGRITLLGDACHPMLPFVAQGAAMAIEDGAVLADCLATAGSVEAPEVTAALARYEVARQARTAWVQRVSRRNATVFHLSGAAAVLRNLAAGVAGDRLANRLYGYDVRSARGGMA